MSERIAGIHADFLAHIREVHDLNAAQSLLSWDQETYMPPEGIAGRARSRATLSGIVHDRVVDPALGDLIDELAAADGLTPEQAANVREARRDRDRAVKVPKELVTELTREGSLAQQAWAEARAARDWARFAPNLERLAALRRREAECVGYAGEPYDAMLDEYEPGMTTAALLPLLAELKNLLVPLVAAVVERGERHDDALLRGSFPVARQQELATRVLEIMGFDFRRGRLDVSRHPFTSGVDPRDVRLTTHYDTGDLSNSLFSTLHEGGHGLYEQGFLVEHAGTPMGEAASLGIHESQSRLWENMVGRSRAFLSHCRPLLTRLFPEAFGDADDEALYRAANVVRRSPVRIEADEMTYNLHIVLRTELETALFRDEIAVADLPGLWNEKMREYLGLTPTDDAEGVLQDIHWAFGSFGYFPTYSLGNLYAAQFYAKAAEDLGDLQQQASRGEFAPLLNWLRGRIHVKGRLLAAPDLCREVTGRDLSIAPFADYLNQKYGELYGL